MLSLFDGISTGRLCLDRAGLRIDTYLSSEINPWAVKISEKNYPDIVRLGDVREIDVNKLPNIDLLIGGSPCQGFSRAGKCLNFDDSRSKLFFEYSRILNEIREYNPNVKFLLENVAMKKEWSDVISEFLGVKSVKINSRDFSAQNRLREYWTNIPILPYVTKDIYLTEILDNSYTPVDLTLHDGIYFDSGISQASRELVSVEDGETRIKQATKKGYIVAEDGDGVIRQLNTLERERLQTLPDNYTECKGVSISARNEAIGNGWTANVITHIFKGLNI